MIYALLKLKVHSCISKLYSNYWSLEVMIVLDSFLIDFFFFLYIYHMCCFLVQLSLGAVQSHGLQKPILSNRNFHGCLENLLYNDLNLLYLAKRNNHQVSAVVSCCVAASLEQLWRTSAGPVQNDCSAAVAFLRTAPPNDVTVHAGCRGISKH